MPCGRLECWHLIAKRPAQCTARWYAVPFSGPQISALFLHMNHDNAPKGTRQGDGFVSNGYRWHYGEPADECCATGGTMRRWNPRVGIARERPLSLRTMKALYHTGAATPQVMRSIRRRHGCGASCMNCKRCPSHPFSPTLFPQQPSQPSPRMHMQF